MYEWRKMTDAQREEILRLRRASKSPWHSPPHYASEYPQTYHLSAACYEHFPVIGKSPGRMALFENSLMDVLSAHAEVRAWCVLPNHWHALITTNTLKLLIKEIGQLHGRSSFGWNKEDEIVGRKCWHCCSDRAMRSTNHLYATLNYIHHNPVKHGYVKRWQEWPFSSARKYLDKVGHEEARRFWNDFPVKDYGKGWDD